MKEKLNLTIFGHSIIVYLKSKAFDSIGLKKSKDNDANNRPCILR